MLRDGSGQSLNDSLRARREIIGVWINTIAVRVGGIHGNSHIEVGSRGNTAAGRSRGIGGLIEGLSLVKVEGLVWQSTGE